ncbi:transmembrane protein 88-like [Narcine bancroftii]|uniref:transmembrane protein 88-like n=1 Tax=Narcine bancroftii TaxID=1343680 RepID=UPI0038316F99
MSDGAAPPRGPAAAGGLWPPPYTPSGRSGGDGPELRSPLDCWACPVLVSAQKLPVAAFNLLLLGATLTPILLPTGIMVGFGLACHSQCPNSAILPPEFFCTFAVTFSILDLSAGRCKETLGDGSSAALVAVGSVLAAPLAVLALAAYCHLARHLHLSLCFVPYSKAVYRNLPASHYQSTGVCYLQPRETAGKIWV